MRFLLFFKLLNFKRVFDFPCEAGERLVLLPNTRLTHLFVRHFF